MAKEKRITIRMSEREVSILDRLSDEFDMSRSETIRHVLWMMSSNPCKSCRESD